MIFSLIDFKVCRKGTSTTNEGTLGKRVEHKVTTTIKNQKTKKSKDQRNQLPSVGTFTTNKKNLLQKCNVHLTGVTQKSQLQLSSLKQKKAESKGLITKF